MGHIDKGCFQFPVQLDQLHTHRRAKLGIQIRQRLIHQKHLRIFRHGSCKSDTLPLTSRERRRASIQIVRQPYLFRYLPDTFLPLLFWYFIIFQSKFNISVNGHRRINGIVLKYHCHIPLSGCHICHILSINQNLSITLRPDTCNHTE